jgi:hypothetical protein
MTRFERIAPVLPVVSGRRDEAVPDLDVDDADYGLRKGTYVDPDGNLLRVGSPLPAT